MIRLRDVDILLKYFNDKELNNFMRSIKYEFLGKQYREEVELKRGFFINVAKHEKEIKREEEKLRKSGWSREKYWEEEKKLAEELKVELDEYTEKLEKKIEKLEKNMEKNAQKFPDTMFF